MSNALTRQGKAPEMTQRTASNLAAERLRLTNIPGTARVRVGDGAGMSLELTGPEKLLAEVKWEVRDGTLHVEGPKYGGGGTMVSTFGPGGRSTVIRSHGGSMTISGGSSVISAGRQTVITTGSGQVIVNGKLVTPDGTEGNPGDVELTVTVPHGTPMGVSDDGAGIYELGSTGGTLDVRLGGAGSVTAGDTDAARIGIRGSGDVQIASVQRALRVDIAGSGDVRVHRGQVDRLQVSIAGSGDVTFGGTAAEADLSVAGSGDIRVDTVTGSLRKNVSGSGDIDVRVQPARSADDFWS